MSPPLIEPDLSRVDDVRRLEVPDARGAGLPMSKEPRGRIGDRGVETEEVPVPWLVAVPECTPETERSEAGVESSIATAL